MLEFDVDDEEMIEEEAPSAESPGSWAAWGIGEPAPASAPVEYLDFLKAKAMLAPISGFEVGASEVHPMLYDFQRDLVIWACHGGRRALFSSFGTGKTIVELEIIRLCLKHGGGGKGLIVLPLGVRQEFRRDAEKLGIPVRFVRRTEELDEDGIYLTNYESVRDGRLDPNRFRAISLDESAVLRSFGSKTYQTFLTLFAQVPYRFVATATPSPNRYKELLHYAGFLGIADTGHLLTRFFQRNPKKANDLTLYPHHEAEFWLWLNSWAIFLQKPSDLNPEYSDEGYDLPPRAVIWHEVAADPTAAGSDRDGQARLFRDATFGVSDMAREKRDTLPARLEKALEILADQPEKSFLIWHDLEREREAIEKSVPGVVTVYGTQDLDEREEKVIAFSEGRIKILASKAVLLGAGCNFQYHCSRAIFLGISYKFHDFIQACHRIYRFLQKEPVEIHIIYAESERGVVDELRRKWKEHDLLSARMTEIVREHGLNRLSMGDLTRTLGCERQEARGNGWLIANNDCVAETRTMEDNSVDLIVTSIPFGNHFQYVESMNDFGYTDDDSHFFAQMDYLTPELIRTLKPGRVACIHVKDRILFGNVTGFGRSTVNPFHAKCIAHYQQHGFLYQGMITVVTDVVRENNQTYRLGWSEQCKDGSKMGVGSPEYILLFAKPPTDPSRGYADEPVKKSKADYTRARWQVDAHALWRSNGNRLLTGAEIAALGPDGLARFFSEYSRSHVYDYEEHVRLGDELEKLHALPATFMCLAPGSHHPDVWHDILRIRTLNAEQSKRRLEQHVCPLQIDLVGRLIERFSSPGELVLDPFAGLMTVPLCAVKSGRRGRGVELNPQYFRDGLHYLQQADAEQNQATLFDLLDEEEEEVPT